MRGDSFGRMNDVSFRRGLHPQDHNNTIEEPSLETLPDVGSILSLSAMLHPISSPTHRYFSTRAKLCRAQKIWDLPRTVVRVREDLLSRSSDALPPMLDYRTHVKNDSLYKHEDRDTFGFTFLGCVTMKWAEDSQRTC
jgi:hypothetical protein